MFDVISSISTASRTGCAGNTGSTATPPVIVVEPAENDASLPETIFGKLPQGFDLASADAHALSSWLRKAMAAVDNLPMLSNPEDDNDALAEAMEPANKLLRVIKQLSPTTYAEVGLQMMAIADFSDWLGVAGSEAMEDLSTAEFRHLAECLAAVAANGSSSGPSLTELAGRTFQISNGVPAEFSVPSNSLSDLAFRHRLAVEAARAIPDGKCDGNREYDALCETKWALFEEAFKAEVVSINDLAQLMNIAALHVVDSNDAVVLLELGRIDNLKNWIVKLAGREDWQVAARGAKKAAKHVELQGRQNLGQPK